MGIEAYGLIAFFTIIQVWVQLLDAGFRNAVLRKMASMSTQSDLIDESKNLLRSVEVLLLIVSFLVFILLTFFSETIISIFISGKSVPTETISFCLIIVSLIIGMQFFESLYVGCLFGLQKHVILNVVQIIFSGLRAVGAYLVLKYQSPTLEAFFIWQIIICVSSTSVFVVLVYRLLPKPSKKAKFSINVLQNSFSYAGGMMWITFTALILSQIDKLFVAKYLELSVFGYYALAGVIASSILLTITPVGNTYFPKFVELISAKNHTSLRLTFHQSCQLVSFLSCSISMLFIFFGQELMYLWSGDLHLSREVSPILFLLSIGTLLNSYMWMPFQLQIAYGWTSLTVIINTVSICFVIPAMIFIIPTLGVKGAAYVWIALNLFALVFGSFFMFRKLMREEFFSWILNDITKPLLTCFILTYIFSKIYPDQENKFFQLTLLSVISLVVFFICGLSTQCVREFMYNKIVNKRK